MQFISFDWKPIGPNQIDDNAKSHISLDCSVIKNELDRESQKSFQ